LKPEAIGLDTSASEHFAESGGATEMRRIAAIFRLLASNIRSLENRTYLKRV